ncbi:MAG: cytochrome C [Opitutales bacterium]
MPIYEYYSPDTHKIYQFFARSLSLKDALPRCPDGDSYRMEKKISNFAYIKGESESGDPSNENLDMDDPKLAGAMAEMEREMSRMDPDNPDPRAMGAMMEKMSSLTGEKLPPDMEEMVGRLKAGEDLESIEEKFGDLMDDDSGEGEGDLGSGGGLVSKLKALRKRRVVQIDPNLYELTDWLS